MRSDGLTTIGLARRAGKLSYGADMTKQAILTGAAKTVFVAYNASPRILRNFTELCEDFKLPLIVTLYTMSELGNAVNRPDTAVISINNKGLSKVVLKHLEVEGKKI